MAPTGKADTAGGVWLSHLRNGKIVELWVYFDALGLLRQVGAKPYLATPLDASSQNRVLIEVSSKERFYVDRTE